MVLAPHLQTCRVADRNQPARAFSLEGFVAREGWVQEQEARELRRHRLGISKALKHRTERRLRRRRGISRRHLRGGETQFHEKGASDPLVAVPRACGGVFVRHAARHPFHNLAPLDLRVAHELDERCAVGHVRDEVQVPLGELKAERQLLDEMRAGLQELQEDGAPLLGLPPSRPSPQADFVAMPEGGPRRPEKLVEAADRAVERIQEDFDQCDDLRRAIPAVRAVHQQGLAILQRVRSPAGSLQKERNVAHPLRGGGGQVFAAVAAIGIEVFGELRGCSGGPRVIPTAIQAPVPLCRLGLRRRSEGHRQAEGCREAPGALRSLALRAPKHVRHGRCPGLLLSALALRHEARVPHAEPPLGSKKPSAPGDLARRFRQGLQTVLHDVDVRDVRKGELDMPTDLVHPLHPFAAHEGVGHGVKHGSSVEDPKLLRVLRSVRLFERLVCH
eukprot:scaffold7346_cov245-Pinguiococcus_pyrenoidosus.AAC.31